MSDVLHETAVSETSMCCNISCYHTASVEDAAGQAMKGRQRARRTKDDYSKG